MKGGYKISSEYSVILQKRKLFKNYITRIQNSAIFYYPNNKKHQLIRKNNNYRSLNVKINISMLIKVNEEMKDRIEKS